MHRSSIHRLCRSSKRKSAMDYASSNPTETQVRIPRRRVGIPRRRKRLECGSVCMAPPCSELPTAQMV